MDRFIDFLENLISVLLLVCLCGLALGALLVWRSWPFCLIFAVCAVIWIFGWRKK